ncbi:unnamed protein product [Pocillopora meandrina]|uniref:EF-hand domain-containing protein n=1 Tax=Pocillopora meandrina TaxID=46732 RepID=A0AAU9WNC5_9CNID|nr:unnamed protein product [Pocillopora meandrina]
MGNRKTKLKTEELSELMECTHFTQGEIEEWYKGFMKSCPNGLVSSADFQDMYSDFFEGDASEFASHVFRTFDSDKSGFIDFKEFMYSLSITSRGNLEEKLEWAFKIYDVDGDGYVTKREMEDIIRSVYKMYADSRLGRKETPEQRTARIFEKFDLNKDGKLTIEEFKTGARSDPFLVLMMQYKSLHGRKESDPVEENMPCLREEDKVDPLEAQLEAQMELSHLQRQYRCLRNDRRMYTDETENTLRKQKITIEALVKEKKELEAMIHVASSRQNEKFDQRNVEKLVELLEREAQAQQELKKEKEAIAGLDEKVAAMREKINQQSKKMGGSKDVYQEKHVANMKLTRILENRLDEMTKKFSIALTGNLKLREHINHVEGQKARFLDLHKRLQAELVEGKKEIDRISEVATTHFTIRDEAQHRMASLRERADREMAVYNAEIKDVKRILEHDRKLRAFMTTKAEDRASILEDELMVRAIKKYEAQLNGLQQETSKFEEIFDKIKEATGIEDTDTLVESFIENEDRNFALYNYVNNMNTEIENLKDDIRRLKDEIELIKKEGVDSDVHRKEILNELEQKMVEVTDELTLVNKEYKASRRQLELLKPKVESVFNSIECDRSSIAELLGIGVSIDDNNIMQYLGIIEQKCNELLQNKALEKIKKLNESGGDISVDGLQGVGPQPAHGNFLIVPPPIEDDSDQAWHCNDTKPLTVEEVQALIQQGNVKGGLSKVTGSTKQPAKRKRA